MNEPILCGRSAMLPILSGWLTSDRTRSVAVGCVCSGGTLDSTVAATNGCVLETPVNTAAPRPIVR